MHCPTQGNGLDSGDTPGLMLDCGGVVNFAGSFKCLGFISHLGLSDHHDTGARIKKATSKRHRDVGNKDGTHAALLCGGESWCLPDTDLKPPSQGAHVSIWVGAGFAGRGGKCQGVGGDKLEALPAPLRRGRAEF